MRIHLPNALSRFRTANPSRLLAIAALAALAALTAALALASPSHAGGPSAELGSCQVFPKPPAKLPPHARSFATETAWNQNISRAPRDPRSHAYMAYILSHGGGSIHPDFGSPREYGIPYVVVGAGQAQLPVHYTEFGSESDPGPFPIPADAPVEGGPHADGDRHVIAVDRDACVLYELFDAEFDATPEPHWNAAAGTALGPALGEAAPSRASPRPTPPACRSSPASCATTKSPPATSTTRSG